MTRGDLIDAAFALTICLLLAAVITTAVHQLNLVEALT